MLTAPSDKELRRLRALCEIDDVDLVPSEGIAIIDELLAARPVVRAAKRWRGYVSNATENKLAEAVDAYDKARRR